MISSLRWCPERVSHLPKVTQPVAVGPGSGLQLSAHKRCSALRSERKEKLLWVQDQGMRHLKYGVRTSGTDPSENVWEDLALGIHSSGIDMVSGLEEENGLCGLAERKVASFVCVRPFSNYRYKTSMATRPCLCLLPRSAWGQEANCSLLPSWDGEPSDAETRLSKLGHFPKRYSPLYWWRKHHKFNPLALVQPMAHWSQELDTTEHAPTHLFLGRVKSPPRKDRQE